MSQALTCNVMAGGRLSCDLLVLVDQRAQDLAPPLRVPRISSAQVGAGFQSGHRWLACEYVMCGDRWAGRIASL